MNLPEVYSLPLLGGETPAPRPCWRFGILCFTLFLLLVPAAAQAYWLPLTERLIADGFDEHHLQMLFSRPEVRFEPLTMAGKISLLASKYQDSSSIPGPVNHNKVYKGYGNSRLIARARSYMRENRASLKDASARYGVPEEIIVSILLVETRLGRSTGRDLVFNRLASMAFCTDLEPIRPYLNGAVNPANEDNARYWLRKKSDWAYNELKALLNYAALNGLDPLDLRGSIYGAIGLCQFMPSNIFSYGVDGDKDGRIDPFVTTDAIHSIANYLQKHGWQGNIGREDRRKVIFAYNNSTVYVNTILAVADRIRGRAGAKR